MRTWARTDNTIWTINVNGSDSEGVFPRLVVNIIKINLLLRGKSTAKCQLTVGDPVNDFIEVNGLSFCRTLTESNESFRLKYDCLLWKRDTSWGRMTSVFYSDHILKEVVCSYWITIVLIYLVPSWNHCKKFLKCYYTST